MVWTRIGFGRAASRKQNTSKKKKYSEKTVKKKGKKNISEIILIRYVLFFRLFTSCRCKYEASIRTPFDYRHERCSTMGVRHYWKKNKKKKKGANGGLRCRLFFNRVFPFGFAHCCPTCNLLTMFPFSDIFLFLCLDFRFYFIFSFCNSFFFCFYTKTSEPGM